METVNKLKPNKLKLAVIGAGNIAHHFLGALKDRFEIGFISSRNLSHALELSKSIGKDEMIVGGLENFPPDIDACLIAVSDDSIKDVVERLPAEVIKIHTSGSTAMDVLGEGSVGVVYPLQTFSKARELPKNDFAVLIEYSDDRSRNIVEKIAFTLTDNVIEIDSESRLKIHIAAVISCNFTNYLLDKSYQLMQEAGLHFEYLRPLIQETLDKALSGKRPFNFQTGPAVRNDENTISKHKSVLKDDVLEIYGFLTDKIQKEFKDGHIRENSLGK